jgi:hypothetical protein
MNLDDEALATLAACEAEFRAGKKKAILIAMGVCTLFGLAPPDWLGRAFIEAVSAGWRSRSWDEVFGPPVADKRAAAALRKRAATRQRHAQIQPRAVQRVRELKQSGRPPPIDECLRMVGKELAVSPSVISRLYYADMSVNIVSVLRGVSHRTSHQKRKTR